MNGNHFYFVNPRILADIYALKSEADLHSRGYVPSNQAFRAIQMDAIRHSIEIEFTDEGKNGGEKAQRRRDRREAERNLLGALNWGIANYEGEISEHLLLELGYRVEPCLNSSGYRAEEAKPKFSCSYYPSPEKIDREITCFLFQNSCIDDIVEKGIHAHFHIARIHPFVDGNGRTARILQDIIFESAGFSSVPISIEERPYYMGVIASATEAYKKSISRMADDSLSAYSELNRRISQKSLTLKDAAYCKKLALKAFGSQMTPEERVFYNYIAAKLKDNLDIEVRKMRGKNRH